MVGLSLAGEDGMCILAKLLPGLIPNRGEVLLNLLHNYEKRTAATINTRATAES
jgi:hypothetical protein